MNRITLFLIAWVRGQTCCPEAQSTLLWSRILWNLRQICSHLHRRVIIISKGRRHQTGRWPALRLICNLTSRIAMISFILKAMRDRDQVWVIWSACPQVLFLAPTSCLSESRLNLWKPPAKTALIHTYIKPETLPPRWSQPLVAWQHHLLFLQMTSVTRSKSTIAWLMQRTCSKWLKPNCITCNSRRSSANLTITEMTLWLTLSKGISFRWATTLSLKIITLRAVQTRSCRECQISPWRLKCWTSCTLKRTTQINFHSFLSL
jgi:hypothetical protein